MRCVWGWLIATSNPVITADSFTRVGERVIEDNDTEVWFGLVFVALCGVVLKGS